MCDGVFQVAVHPLDMLLSPPPGVLKAFDTQFSPLSQYESGPIAAYAICGSAARDTPISRADPMSCLRISECS